MIMETGGKEKKLCLVRPTTSFSSVMEMGIIFISFDFSIVGFTFDKKKRTVRPTPGVD